MGKTVPRHRTEKRMTLVRVSGAFVTKSKPVRRMKFLGRCLPSNALPVKTWKQRQCDSKRERGTPARNKGCRYEPEGIVKVVKITRGLIFGAELRNQWRASGLVRQSLPLFPCPSPSSGWQLSIISRTASPFVPSSYIDSSIKLAINQYGKH